MPKNKLTEQQVAVIRCSHLPIKELAYRYNVSVAAIQDIKSGRTWPNVGYNTGPYEGRNRKLEAKGIDY
jgi:hypothetical protein